MTFSKCVKRMKYRILPVLWGLRSAVGVPGVGVEELGGVGVEGAERRGPRAAGVRVGAEGREGRARRAERAVARAGGGAGEQRRGRGGARGRGRRWAGRWVGARPEVGGGAAGGAWGRGRGRAASERRRGVGDEGGASKIVAVRGLAGCVMQPLCRVPAI